MRQAEVDLIEDHRERCLLDQIDRWHRANDPLAYLDAMRRRIADLVDPKEVAAAQEWSAWVEHYVATVSPLSKPLMLPTPPKSTPDSLKPYLNGLSPYGPGILF
jgi:hypothetical protein